MIQWLACFTTVSLIAAGAAAQDSPSDAPDREFALSLYLWGAELEGELEADRGTADVDASFSDLLENLNVGVNVAAAARVGRFVGLFDGIWMELEDETDRGVVRVRAVTLGPAERDANLREGMADLKLGYRILEPEIGARQPVAVDLLAGGRYWYMRTEIDLDFAILPDRSFTESTDWVDPIVGVRVILGLTPALQLMVLGDVGGWDVGSASDHTWQAMAVLGVTLSEAWRLHLGYRALDIERGAADIEMRGPLIGTSYHF